MPGPDFQRERTLNLGGMRHIAGVDEAGRGPLAGPVAAAAVILDPARLPEGLDDSKRLSETAREALHDIIMRDALAVGLALVPPATIDEINILQATFLAMRRALAALAIQPDHALIDGRDVPAGLRCPAEAIIGGDGLSASIAAASIIAKVSRDRLMRRLGAHCPAYSFEVHKGYGTALHRRAIGEHGVSAHHRRSFAPCRNGTP
jgi:ribonuclease HII